VPKIVALLLMIDGPEEAEKLLEKWAGFMARVQSLADKKPKKEPKA